MTNNIKFIGLHGHSTVGSPGDAIGFPSEHMNFAFDNGMNALALTDHGNMNGFSWQYLHAMEMNKKGKDFKPIFGCEVYYIDDIENWHDLKEEISKDKKLNKKDTDDEIIENEEETKSSTKRDPLKIRSHLVLIAKNEIGLQNLFKLISKSYSDYYFYKYPRIDFKLLNEHKEGLIISSACLSKDCLLETNFGLITIKTAIDKFKNHEEIYVISYNLEKNICEFKKIIWGDLTRKNSKLLKIKLKNGKEIKCTQDHLVYTNFGWVKAGELTNEMRIFSF